MTRRVSSSPSRSDAGAHPRDGAATAARNGAAHAPRRRDRALTPGDRAALGVGGALVLLMLAWGGWRLGQTVARDRAVAPGVAPAPVMPGH
ncbi:hypothetical protein rosag_46790 [Roseisolibacter agri]|uniref:Uncharacterized protein n=1 Tax=Roseisolibacter agri TaxID=2014610 RepID=A0AA37V8U4_9BACT|nr:hypothetical protein rosag_46790 [Roseisolibacter agri]